MYRDTQPLLKAEGISKIYAQGALAVGLHRFTAAFYKGEFVAITGSSGSGKSTLLNLLSGLDSYDEGELYFLGEPTSHYTEEDRAAYRMNHVAFIFQDSNILDSYTVYQNIELALLYRIPDPKARKERIDALIEAVGLAGHEKQKCSKLSGGQKQRVSIARALAKDAPILFADEPCGNLDSAMTDEIMRLLHEVSRDKLVIMVTHSYDEVAPYATRKIRLADGELVEDQIYDEIALEVEDVPTPNPSRKEQARALLHVAMNNIKATPKRSVFGLVGLGLLTTIFIIGMLLVVTMMDPGIMKNDAYKYDLQVCKSALAFDYTDGFVDSQITAQEIAAIEAIEGVGAAYRDSAHLNGMVVVGKSGIDSLSLYARPDFNATGKLYSGRHPENANEVLLSLPASRRYIGNVKVGDVVDIIDYSAYMVDIDYVAKQYTVVGIILDDTDCAYFTDEFFEDPAFYADDAGVQLVVACENNANLTKIREKLHDMGYTAFHRYGDHPYEDLSAIIKFLTIFGMFFGMVILFRIITGSYRALEATKRNDYNIMRTVGLPNTFVKSIYYCEMGLQGLIGWLSGVVLAIVIGLVYGLAVTPDVAYGFKLIGRSAADLAWIVVVALVADMVVTLGNAVRFNRYFYRQTVKMSLKEAAQHD